MPRMDGLETTRAVRREFPRTIVMVLTAYDDPDSLSEALKAGAAGFLLKTSPPAEIVEAVRKVLTGESPLSTEVATQLLMRLVDLVEKQPRDAPKEQRLLESLTPREDEVLQLMVAGQTNQQIASKLLVSTSTVKKHVHSVISKLEVSDRTQAAVMALELGVRPEQRKD
jgi:DNA-binding NarL/FixJ family response regulator